MKQDKRRGRVSPYGRRATGLSWSDAGGVHGASRVTSCTTGAPHLPLRATLLSHGTGTHLCSRFCGPARLAFRHGVGDWSGSLPPWFCGGVSGVSLLAWGFGPSQGWGFCISPECVVPSTERHALYRTQVRRLPPSDTSINLVLIALDKMLTPPASKPMDVESPAGLADVQTRSPRPETGG